MASIDVSFLHFLAFDSGEIWKIVISGTHSFRIVYIIGEIILNFLSLTQVNAVQREQLEVAHSANQKLNQDIQRLTKQWEEFSRQLEESKGDQTGYHGDQDVANHQRVGALWKEILDFRRQMITVKVSLVSFFFFSFWLSQPISDFFH